jgi:hypothetical protein
MSFAAKYPEVTIICTGGHRSRTTAARFIPSMLPGISMSVKTIRMPFRLSKISIASSALLASIGLESGVLDHTHSQKALHCITSTMGLEA